MKIEWKGPVNGVHWCETGLLLLSVTEQHSGWLIVVDNADTGDVCASEDGFAGTLDEAKRRAFRMGSEVVAPLFDAARVEAGRVEEREACAARIKQAADQLDAAAARIGELVAERDMAKAMIDDLNDDLIRVLQERNAARAEEREACAALVDQLAIKASSSWHRHQEVLRDAAAAIRARSMETKP